MNETELIELLMSQDVILITVIILFLIGLVSVMVHWLILGKRALEIGRVRVESMNSAVNCEKNDNDDLYHTPFNKI
ncbi:MAG TPA: hypothetical protein C5S50_11370 [Methanosarcinaceae archaeon]|nr:hypothetical protein [Methanosarcinaceae archaeon]